MEKLLTIAHSHNVADAREINGQIRISMSGSLCPGDGRVISLTWIYWVEPTLDAVRKFFRMDC